MALTAQEQELFDHAAASLPEWSRAEHQVREFLFGCAKAIGYAVTVVDHWLVDQALIGSAADATATEPDYLDELAKDRGTRRQVGEDGPTLRARLRNVPDVVTRPALVAALDELLVASGGSAGAAVFSLRLNKAYLGDQATWSGTGGGITVADADDYQVFTPDAPWDAPPFRGSPAPLAVDYRLFLAGMDASVNGEHTIIGLDGDGAVIENAGGIADTGGTWEVRLYGPDGERMDGFSKVFASRGHRVGGYRKTIVAILPEGNDALIPAARELLREKAGAAAGHLAIVQSKA